MWYAHPQPDTVLVRGALKLPDSGLHTLFSPPCRTSFGFPREKEGPDRDSPWIKGKSPVIHNPVLL